MFDFRKVKYFLITAIVSKHNGEQSYMDMAVSTKSVFINRERFKNQMIEENGDLKDIVFISFARINKKEFKEYVR